MRRQQTHLPAQAIVAWRDRYPHLASFIQGYLVHCLTDSIDLGRIFYRRLPFSLLKGTLTQRHLAVLLELYYLERQPVTPRLSGTHNEVLSELGLSASVSERFAQAAKQFAMPLSQADPLASARLLGLENDSRIEQYAAAARLFQKSRVLKTVLFLGIRTGKVDEQIGSRVSALYRQSGAAVSAPVERRVKE
jgi:hypothetical protein